MAEKINPYKAEDTGHEWDGIRELKNDPPRWWMICLYLSGLYMLAYFVLYPAIPLASDYTKGVMGWTQINEYEEGLREVKDLRASYDAKIKGMTAAAILKDPQLNNFTVASTRVLFGDKCAPCHGAGGQGAKDFPVLADDDWLYGGKMQSIQESIAEGRQGVMPAYSTTLSAGEIDDLVKFIKGLPSGNIYEPGRQVFMGETAGEAECYTCHGEDGRGNIDMGSANLADSIWRFDGTDEGIRHTILHGVNSEDDQDTRKAVMPAWGAKLTENQIKGLSVYVYMLGGGQEG